MRSYDRKIPKFLQNIIENSDSYMLMKDFSPITLDQLQILTDLVIKTYLKLSNLVYLGKLSDNFSDLLIVGDTHGDFKSTLRIIQPFFEKKVGALLFLGDYVDRGDFNFLNLIFIVSLSIAWPERVILLRGNHEDIEINRFFGFYEEIQEYFPTNHEFKQVLSMINTIYNLMSLAAVTPNKSICMHAGIAKDFSNINPINGIPKPHELIEYETDEILKKMFHDIFMEIRWNDPTENLLNGKHEKSYHGYYYYDKKMVDEFLQENHLDRIIKSHEAKRGGFEQIFSKKLLHLFSNEPYFGKIKQATTIHEQKNGIISIRNLDFELIEKL